MRTGSRTRGRYLGGQEEEVAANTDDHNDDDDDDDHNDNEGGGLGFPCGDKQTLGELVRDSKQKESLRASQAVDVQCRAHV